MRKWRKNGVAAKTPKCEKPCKYSIFQGDVEIYETRNRNILTDFHNSMYLYKSP